MNKHTKQKMLMLSALRTNRGVRAIPRQRFDRSQSTTVNYICPPIDLDQNATDCRENSTKICTSSSAKYFCVGGGYVSVSKMKEKKRHRAREAMGMCQRNILQLGTVSIRDKLTKEIYTTECCYRANLQTHVKLSRT